VGQTFAAVVHFLQRRLIGGALDKSEFIGRPRFTGNPNVTPARNSVTGLTVYERVAEADVEGQIVAHLPDGSDQGEKCLRLVDDAVGIDFEKRSDFPFARSFDDRVKEKFGMLVGREVRCRVQMNGSPIPPL
jgi:hypothetical protein